MRVFILAFLLVMALPGQADWYKKQQDHMGTRITVEVWADTSVQGQQAIDAVMAEMARIDAGMSPYKPDSELSRLNRLAVKQAVPVSAELFALIEKAQQVSVLTHGAFDITFASVGHHYDYRQQAKPDEQTKTRELARIDYRHLTLSATNKSIQYQQAGVKIDLGGIAKGHAVARGLALLKQHGIRHGLVMAGGDTGLLGDRRGRPWMVGIQDPRDDSKQAVIIPLENVSMSTSGDYERFFIEDGVRYHHILHPKTGDSAREVQSVSVIGPDSTMTDALSTSVFVLGVEAGLALINNMPDYDVIIVDNQRQLHYSQDLLAQ